MSILVEDVKHIAKLARLNFTDEELNKLSLQLSDIVDMANEIEKLDTENVKPTAHILENTNVFRKDEVKPSYDREEILKNAPTKESGCISVPRVVE